MVSVVASDYRRASRNLRNKCGSPGTQKKKPVCPLRGRDNRCYLCLWIEGVVPLKSNARVCVASDADRFVRLFVDRITANK